MLTVPPRSAGPARDLPSPLAPDVGSPATPWPTSTSKTGPTPTHAARRIRSMQPGVSGPAGQHRAHAWEKRCCRGRASSFATVSKLQPHPGPHRGARATVTQTSVPTLEPCWRPHVSQKRPLSGKAPTLLQRGHGARPAVTTATTRHTQRTASGPWRRTPATGSELGSRNSQGCAAARPPPRRAPAASPLHRMVGGTAGRFAAHAAQTHIAALSEAVCAAVAVGDTVAARKRCATVTTGAPWRTGRGARPGAAAAAAPRCAQRGGHGRAVSPGRRPQPAISAGVYTEAAPPSAELPTTAPLAMLWPRRYFPPGGGCAARTE